MGVEKMIFIGLIGIGLIGAVLYGISEYLFRKGKKVWNEKKVKINFAERIAYKWFIFLEELIIGHIDKETIDKIIKHLVEVFDYIAIKEPDIKNANEYLETATYMKITDFWDGPYGRVLKIAIEQDEEYSRAELRINISDLIDRAYKSRKKEEEKIKRPKLRIIK